MNCLVCDTKLESFFNEYEKCPSCGFVAKRDVYEMSDKEWSKLNHDYHSGYQQTGYNPDDPRWHQRLEHQAKAIYSMYLLGLIPQGLWLDYGAGDASLGNTLSKFDTPKLLAYDKYMEHTNHYLQDSNLIPGSFSLVTNTSVFEHVRDRETLDSIVNLVHNLGVFALHVDVREEVPSDPNWHYYIPVHCSFYTNKCMQILFDTWGFNSSFYDVQGRMWFWFKRDTPFKKGFMDYWKNT